VRNLAISNWLRRARLAVRRKAKATVDGVEVSNLLEFTQVMEALDDAETCGVDVGFSEMEVSAESSGVLDDVFGTPVNFLLMDD